MVFPRYRAVIFVHGCFWHAHECHLFKWPSTREDFWRNKILGNREIDAINKELLLQSGWRTGIVWECAIKGKYRLDTEELIGICAQWLTSDIESTEIGGQY
jgi:DNA mismatch endonuclease (patch repair protein)